MILTFGDDDTKLHPGVLHLISEAIVLYIPVCIGDRNGSVA